MSSAVDKKTNYSGLVQFTVLTLMMVQYTQSIPTPALGAIQAAFPDVDYTSIKLVTTIPTLVVMITSFLCGYMEKFMKKRTLALLGTAIVCIFGLAPLLTPGNFTAVLVFRFVYGIGLGIVFPLVASLIADLFEGKTRDRLMGFRGALGALTGAAYQALAGYLAGISWQYSMFVHLIVIPIFILLWFKLPEPPRVAVSEGEKPKNRLAAFTPMTWIIIIFNGIAMFFFFSFMTNCAMIFVGEEIGTSAQVGSIMSMMTLGSFAGALVFGPVFGALKRFHLPISVAVIACGFLILVNGYSVAFFIAGAIVFGIGWGNYTSRSYLLVADSVKEKDVVTFAMGIFVAINCIGQFVGPYVLKAISSIIGLSGLRAEWQITLPCIIAGFVVLLIYALIPKKNGIKE